MLVMYSVSYVVFEKFVLEKIVQFLICNKYLSPINSPILIELGLAINRYAIAPAPIQSDIGTQLFYLPTPKYKEILLHDMLVYFYFLIHVCCMCRTLFCGLHEKVRRNTAMKNVFTLIIYLVHSVGLLRGIGHVHMHSCTNSNVTFKVYVTNQY